MQTKLTTEKFEQIIEKEFAHFAERKIFNCDCYYNRKILMRESKNAKLTYIIQVYKNNELWKTFWIDQKGVDARILDNFNSLTESKKYKGTQKAYLQYEVVEDFEKKIRKLSQEIFDN